jgi:virulence-associated protein VagC
MTALKIADVIEQGQRQTVLLPPDVRLPSGQVEVNQFGNTVTLSPLRERKTPEEMAAWFAEIDRHAEGRFMEEGRNQPPLPRDVDAFD